MQDEKFKTWLTSVKKYSKRTVQNRISNCRNVEKFHRDLDIEYGIYKGVSLMADLTYTTAEFLVNAVPKHKIPIDGNNRTGSVTLKASVKLYMEFRKSL